MDISSALKHLLCDPTHYAKSFHVFLSHSREHQCMVEFFDKELAAILERIGTGKSSIDVLGIGSGSGEMDLHMLRKIQEKHPGVHITSDIVEPTADQITMYKELVSKSQNLENMNFIWHQMTSSEYEQQIKEKNENKKWDFIHMIQVLYYMDNFEETIRFFHQHLEQNGRMLIILVSGNSGWASFYEKFGYSLPLKSDICALLTSQQVKEYIKKMGMKYQHFNLSSVLDITECFVDGNEKGELLLDFMTQALHFSKTAPPNFKAELLKYLKEPKCSTVKDEQILFNSNANAIVIEP